MAANTTFTTGAVLTSAQMNNLPWGVMGTVYRTTGDFTATTSFTDITGLSITFTAVAGRLYRASWGASGRKETAAGYTQISLTNSSNTLVGYCLGYTVTTNFVNLSGVVVISGLSAGSNTFKLRGIAENNTSTIFGSTNAPLTFIIEDMGAA